MPLPASRYARNARYDGLGAARYYHNSNHAVKRGLLHRFGAGDLTGLEGGEAGGLYAGLACGF